MREELFKTHISYKGCRASAANCRPPKADFVDRSWTLEAEKQRRGDPPAITCRFFQGSHGNSGLDRRIQRRSFFACILCLLRNILIKKIPQLFFMIEAKLRYLLFIFELFLHFFIFSDQL